jgi:hypothetical protein
MGSRPSFVCSLLRARRGTGIWGNLLDAGATATRSFLGEERTMLIKDIMEQPFRLDQKVVVEKRTADGQLDFSDPQPPLSAPGKCPHCKGLTFRDVYKMYFTENPTGSASADWAELKAWLDERHWVVRARTW